VHGAYLIRNAWRAALCDELACGVNRRERGKLVALPSPAGGARNTRDRLVASGRLIPASSPSGRLPSPHPIPVAADEPTNQALLDVECRERL